MTPFKMTLTLASPVVMPFNTTLDGLLSFAGEALTGKLDNELADEIPLARDAASGAFKASSIFLSHAAVYENLVKVRALKHWDVDASMIGPKRTKTGNLARAPYPAIDKKRGDYGNKLSVLTTLRTPKAVCYGVGDMDKVKLWMECVIGLGRHAQQGQGEITNVEIEEIEEDLSWMNAKGEPQRPLPVEVWKQHGGSMEGVTTTTAPWQFPYWQQPLERCVAPAHVVTRI